MEWTPGNSAFLCRSVSLGSCGRQHDTFVTRCTGALRMLACAWQGMLFCMRFAGYTSLRRLCMHSAAWFYLKLFVEGAGCMAMLHVRILCSTRDTLGVVLTQTHAGFRPRAFAARREYAP
eukprot:1362690-Pleurochrysis_carterae.AAC.1